MILKIVALCWLVGLGIPQEVADATPFNAREIATLDSETCGITPSGVTIKAIDRICPTLPELEREVQITAKLANVPIQSLSGTTVILYPYDMTCGTVLAIGCTIDDHTSIVELEYGWRVFHHELLHVALWKTKKNPDAHHNIWCDKWHQIDPDQPCIKE